MENAEMMQQPLATQRASFPRTPDTHDYGDRSYVMTEIPEFMVGMHFIRTANDDKRADATDLDFLCFHVDMRAVVFVLYDSRATSLPEWLSSVYTDQHVQALMTTDTGMVEGFEIYYSDVEAGQVCMGGNGITGSRLELRRRDRSACHSKHLVLSDTCHLGNHHCLCGHRWGLPR